MTITNRNGSDIPALIHSFDARYGAGREKVVHLNPIVGRTESQLEYDFVAALRTCAVTPFPAKIAWCASVGLLEGAVETSKTSEACGQRNFRDWQAGLIEQTLGEV